MNIIYIKKMPLKQIGIAMAIVVLLIISAIHHCGDKTMVVDFQRLWKEVKIYQGVSEKYVAYQQGLKIKFNEGVLALQKEDQELSAQKKKLGDTAFKKKAGELQQKAGALKQQYSALSTQASQEVEKTLQGVKPQIDAVIQKVAKKRGATLILNKEFAVYVDDAQDITDAVIEAINKEIPTLPTVENKTEVKDETNG